MKTTPIYLLIDGETKGPFTRDEVVMQWNQNALPPETLAALEGADDWKSVDDFLQVANVSNPGRQDMSLKRLSLTLAVILIPISLFAIARADRFPWHTAERAARTAAKEAVPGFRRVVSQSHYFARSKYENVLMDFRYDLTFEVTVEHTTYFGGIGRTNVLVHCTHAQRPAWPEPWQAYVSTRSPAQD